MAGVNVVGIMGGFVFKLNQKRDAVRIVYRPAGRAAGNAERHFDNAGNT